MLAQMSFLLRFSTQNIRYDGRKFRPLQYDYYSESCPHAEEIIRTTLRNISESHPEVVPAIVRLVFHDCFIKGCDASVLLDTADGIKSEKETPPNESLKGFDFIDVIKLNVEEACPGVVSCADILVLAARESVVLAGGPFYPLATGRRDSTISFPDVALLELPSPQDLLSRAVQLFASKGFNEREAVSLLGTHSIGTMHCKFFLGRLYNFNGTDQPDPSLDTEILDILRSRCDKNESLSSSVTSSSPSFRISEFSQFPTSEEPETNTDNKNTEPGFGTLYYQTLLQGRGLLFVDQQLMAGEETRNWVREYASELSSFRRDFAQAMMKLSNLQVLTTSMGQIRSNCRKVN